jgi:thiamine pyrophosphokinase
MPAEEVVSEELVVVIAGGDAPHADAARAVPAGAPVIAADRGLEHALALGLDVRLAVGDFDSATPSAVAAAEAAGIAIERHPPGKDATDLELALDAAAALEPRRILVLAGDGGRLDHLFSAVLLLGSDRYAEVEVDALVGGSAIHVVRGARTLSGTRGELVSLLAVGGCAEGVRTEGLAYRLDRETLEPGSSRGVSNVFEGEQATISVERGTLLVVRPSTESETE